MADVLEWVPIPRATELATFMGWPQDDATTPILHAHARTARWLVYSYTRGVGFEPNEEGEYCTEAIRAVILSVAARSVNNPTNSARVEIASYSEVPGRLDGFTLMEQAILHQFRRRTA